MSNKRCWKPLMFEKKHDLTNKKTYKYMGKVIEYWNELKGM